MIQRRAWAGAVIGLLLTAAIAVPALAAAKFDTGTYVAKVGHVGFRFKVIGYTPDQCGTRSGTYCLIALTYPKIREPCTNGQAEDNEFAVPNGKFSSSGKFSYSQKLSSDSPLISFTAVLKGDRVTGTLREKDVYDDGTGALIPCDSGTLHWSATRRK